MPLTQPTGQPAPLTPGEFVSASHPTEVTFNLKQLAPPSNLYVRPEEGLLITFYSSNPNLVAVSIGYRLMLTNGQLQIGNVLYPVVNGRVVNQFLLPLPEGYLLNVVIQSSSPNVSTERGQLWLVLRLSRGQIGGPLTSGYLLLSGYITEPSGLAWPGGPMLNPVDGVGWAHSIQQANPAAGADWTYTVPAFSRQRPISLAATLTTSATVANRNVQLIIDDGANIVWQTSVAASIPATTTDVITAAQTNAPTGVVTTTQSMVIPPSIVLKQGSRIRTSTVALQAGDQWSGIFLLIEEWIEPA